MEHSQVIELLKVVGTLIIAAITGVIGAILKLSKSDLVTQEKLSCEKDKIYDDMNCKIKEVKSEMATKESVQHLAEGLDKLGKKFDEFQKMLQDMAINVAVLAERRGQPRNENKQD